MFMYEYLAVSFSGAVTGAVTGDWELLLNAADRRRSDAKQQQQQPNFIFLTERKAT